MSFAIKHNTKIQEIIARYPEGKQKSALIPLLHLAQEENNGWLSVEAMDYVASLLQLTSIEVYEVATVRTPRSGQRRRQARPNPHQSGHSESPLRLQSDRE